MGEGNDEGRLSTAEKHRRFAEEYIVDLNATRAAERAGYSPKTAHAQGHRLLRDAEVEKMIAELKSQRRANTGDLASRVLEELKLIAFSDIGDVIRVDPDGKVYVRELDAITPEARRAIGEITQNTTESTERGPDGESTTRVIEKVRLGVKHHSKVAALKMLMDHLGMNAPVKQEVSVEMRSVKESLGEKLGVLRSRIAQPG